MSYGGGGKAGSKAYLKPNKNNVARIYLASVQQPEFSGSASLKRDVFIWIET